jgi:YfiH family protein
MTCIKANWPAPNNLIALTSTRQDGISSAPFDSFNIGEHVGDDLDSVTQNRTLLSQRLALPSQPLWLKQTHGNVLLDAKDHQPGVEADAIFSTQKNQVLAIQTADCLPILLASQDTDWIAGIHAGWQGFTHDLIEKTVNAYKGSKDSLMAWFGPAISGEAFEIGQETLECIVRDANERALATPHPDPNKVHLSLTRLAKHRLSKLGVHNVYFSNHCTFQAPELFYSYRRDGVTGRMVSLIYRINTQNT